MSEIQADDGSAERVIGAVLNAIRRDNWTRIDAAWDRTRIPRGIHTRRDTALDAESFLGEAVATAWHRRFLRSFIHELVYDDLLTEKGRIAISRLPDGPTWELHSFQNGRLGLVNALLEGKNLIVACDHVCRVDIDGEPVGTGVQVAPLLVATAAHVIERLTLLGEDGTLREAVGSAGRLSLTFRYWEDYGDEEWLEPQLNAGEVAPLHHRWLAWGSGWAKSDDPDSNCSITSLSGITSDDGPWDIAFMQLAEPRKKQRRPIRLLESAPPAKPFPINILHHPNGGIAMGQPMLLSRGMLRSHIGEPLPVRCLHDANTSPGSSGAPVFDSKWRVVALHQGGMRAAWRDNTGAENRAVPVGRWRDQVAAVERSLDDDGMYLRELVTSTDPAPQSHPYPHPVIGRRRTQWHVLRAMRPGAAAEERLLIVRGEPGTGLRFTRRLIQEMVSGTDGTVAVLDMANALNASADAFTERIAGTFSVAAALPGPGTLTTEQRAIRDDLVPALGQLLDSVAGEHPVWLVLEGFGEASAPIPAPLTDLVGDLIERLPDFPSLRLALVGWTRTPAGYESSIEELRLPTPDDVIRYLHPSGKSAAPATVKAVYADFEFAADLQAVSYPFALQKALEYRRMLDPGDIP